MGYTALTHPTFYADTPRIGNQGMIDREGEPPGEPPKRFEKIDNYCGLAGGLD